MIAQILVALGIVLFVGARGRYGPGRPIPLGMLGLSGIGGAFAFDYAPARLGYGILAAVAVIRLAVLLDRAQRGEAETEAVPAADGTD